MPREWFLLVQGKKEGPYSIDELKSHPRLTPDTLVWKKGFSKWVRAGSVHELKKIFKDEEAKEKKETKYKGSSPVAEQILAERLPPFSLFWLILILLILLYSIYRLYFPL